MGNRETEGVGHRRFEIAPNRPDTVSHLASVRQTTASMSNPAERVEIITSVKRRLQSTDTTAIPARRTVRISGVGRVRCPRCQKQRSDTWLGAAFSLCVPPFDTADTFVASPSVAMADLVAHKDVRR